MTVRGMAGAGKRWQGLSANTRAILWMLLGTVMFSVMTALIKAMAARYDSLQIAFFRSFCSFLTFLPIVLAGGFQAFRTAMPMQHVLRGLVGVMAMLSGYYAVANLPLALSTSISFATPLFLVVLAVFVLGETVGWRRWGATAVGFAGVLVCVRPTHGIAPAAIVGMVSAALVACSVVVTKKMPVSERAITIVIWSTMTSSVTALIPALAVWRTPDLHDLVFLAATGVVGAGGQAIFVHSYRLGEASVVGPVDYVRLVFATMIGLAWFGEWPDQWTAVGAALIVASTAYIAHRESVRRRQIPKPQPVA
ncbi:MAG: DMT family transporter [Alphaproteobacteria bacterium]|nr:DMT family transporter [Alphaproteobacteria bacterium]